MALLLSTSGRNLEGLILSGRWYGQCRCGEVQRMAWRPCNQLHISFFVNLWESGNPPLTRSHSSAMSDIVIGGPRSNLEPMI